MCSVVSKLYAALTATIVYILSIAAGALVCMMSTSYSQASLHLGLLSWLHSSSYSITAHFCIRYTVLIALRVVLVLMLLVSVQLAICAAC
jgi:hypothetical protein